MISFITTGSPSGQVGVDLVSAGASLVSGTNVALVIWVAIVTLLLVVVIAVQFYKWRQANRNKTDLDAESIASSASDPASLSTRDINLGMFALTGTQNKAFVEDTQEEEVSSETS